MGSAGNGRFSLATLSMSRRAIPRRGRSRPLLLRRPLAAGEIDLLRSQQLGTGHGREDLALLDALPLRHAHFLHPAGKARGGDGDGRVIG
jgi:hypothetical protein